MVSFFHPVFSEALPASAMFNNNNYLPNLNHCPITDQLQNAIGTHPQPSGDQHALGLQGSGMQVYTSGANFRFLSPTQGTSVPTWAPAVTSVGMTSAPGVGVNWQHSVPTPMPWANHVPPHFSAQALQSISSPQQSSLSFIRPFSAESPGSEHNSEVFPHSMPVFSHHRLLKRRSQSPTGVEGPTSKRRLSEKMAAWFKGLQITNGQEPLGANSAELGPNSYQDGWQRFCELEKRLEDDLDVVEEDIKNKEPNEPRLVFTNGIKKNLTPEPILPEAVINKINKPCMELILWQPPEAVLKNEKNDLVTHDDSNNSANKGEDEMTEVSDQTDKVSGSLQMANWFDSEHSSNNPRMQINSTALTSNMFDCMDDDMDL